MRTKFNDVNFQDLNLTTPLLNALQDLELSSPTPIQEQSFPVILSGRDMVGIAQTGTGKTLAYLLPLLKMLKYSEQKNPRVLILVPTRELVVQVTEELEKISKYINNRILGIYGGTNINTQKQMVAQGQDIIVATPGRLYDLAINRDLQLKSVQKLVIDEVDVMLDLGFRFQLNNILELLPKNRQNIMFSATMTEDVENLIGDYFKGPETVSVAASGAPLENIHQVGYEIPNYYTKVNLLKNLLQESEKFHKVLIFTGNKRMADRLFGDLDLLFPGECSVIHSNKTQNYRLRSIEEFGEGHSRILIATDVMARGLDIEQVSHVINFDTPPYPENYIHRIGRTGRAEKEGQAILFFTPAEKEELKKIESLMNLEIEKIQLPEEVEISDKKIPEEQPQIKEIYNPANYKDEDAPGPAFHEKSDKNKKVNLGGSYRREIKKKYKKPKTRGDKNYNRRKKR
ncbi:ATP-dependent RNA helicase RhlE [Salinimicrobium catena]|uniref:ATP-dependent RNA helicase RhlE n=1 Tax=Salinimicrobium catena TaxID=390640 RepID=A0A1H5LBN9_9FLAO|nr:ATP-dependent RNA helicase RhlE [Salinimicrobium catena]SEE74435.1 ATP-dependent RNA helicase RhlE [Salinimicrobium catena]